MADDKSAVDNAEPAQPKPPAGDIADQLTGPVKDFDVEKAPDNRRTFGNGDTDRTDHE